MAADVWTFVAACTVCMRSKSSHRPSAGLLQPLPHPTPPPRSHIAVDFVTGLPPSEGNTAILTVVDRFSKVEHFVPLPKLPTTLETANLLIQHVFRLHGILRDIVSDRSPQFTSSVEVVLPGPGYHLQPRIGLPPPVQRADRTGYRAPAPSYQVRQQVWLSRDLHLQTESRKLAPMSSSLS